jgi:hypothetical protein
MIPLSFFWLGRESEDSLQICEVLAPDTVLRAQGSFPWFLPTEKFDDF